MENTELRLATRSDFELAILRSIWERSGNAQCIMNDRTEAMIPAFNWDRQLGDWEKVKSAYERLVSRGCISLRTQNPENGVYFIIPLIIKNKDAVEPICELMKTVTINPLVYSVGNWVINYDEYTIIAVQANIPNIPSAKKMIHAFVKWVGTQTGCEATTADRVPMDATSFIKSKNYNFPIEIELVSRLTGEKYDTGETPMPPMWASEMDLSKEPNVTDIFASISGTPIIQRNGITLISGAAKSGKTLLVSSIIASITGRSTVLGITPGNHARILWCDTEQSENDISTVRKRIERMSGCALMSADIKALRLRSFGPEQSVNLIENALLQFSPDIILIDGPGDLCPDTNDIASSQATVKTLLRWCDEYDCAVVGVVHTNPGSEKTRGHIGSEIERKCAFSLLTAKNDALDTEYPTFKVKPGFMRGKSFKAYSFRYNEDGLPELVDNTDLAKMSAEDSLLGELETGFSYSYSQLLQRASEIDITEGTAKSAISRLIRKGKLEKSESGYTIIGG